MWTINQMEQFSPFGGVLEMSHREEPRSGRGCFGAVVVVPFLALGGMFALIALTGSPSEAPLAAPPPSRPTSQWWTEPFEDGISLSTVTETVMVEGAAREVRAARTATQTRVVGSTVTETVRVSSAKSVGVGRNEPGEPEEEEPVPSSASPVVTSSVVVSSVEPAPPAESPAESPGSAPPVEAPPSSTPRAEDPVSPVVTPPVTSPVTPPVTSPVVPPCDRAEPPVEEAEVLVEVLVVSPVGG
ncbi:hypothetical protein SAMN04488074_108169 [Lentzea albidocapillata subsp. violacea]|uniref:Uncharacterized protein n=1 Tax=Lentzea albidocapillata subsp. violacea TaxID=128104 RepID=A0A1G9GCZ5_9PSEU|nr:hypothetical protein [Lentzea albidocapillata]SDK98482.1 hypothetical protein SAMN04488074_108169 [Lentzea albidocapillata subsp. violacea]